MTRRVRTLHLPCIRRSDCLLRTAAAVGRSSGSWPVFSESV